MKKLKYVILDDQFPVVFDGCFKHSSFSNAQRMKATSAGFCQIDWENKAVHVYGESISLGLKSMGDDVVWLNKLFFEDSW